MRMETGRLESLPEIIECDGYRGSWPNIPGAKLTGTVDVSFRGNKKYRYTFNNLWNEKVTFCLELIGREFELIESFKIIKITTKI
jgi:hypothetical protein